MSGETVTPLIETSVIVLVVELFCIISEGQKAFPVTTPFVNSHPELGIVPGACNSKYPEGKISSKVVPL
jgi:hypothetical protein